MPGILDLLKQVRKKTVDGVDVWFRSASVERVLEVEGLSADSELPDKIPLMRAVISDCLCHPDGTPADKQELEAIKQLGLPQLVSMFKAAMSASGVGEDEEDDALKN